MCNVCIVGFYLFTFCQSDSGNTQSQPKKFKFQVILNPIIFTHDILDNTWPFQVDSSRVLDTHWI